MSICLGLDTSNYTTSAAVYDAAADALRQVKRLLPVKEGAMGLRQSDAVFHHVRQLPDIMEELFSSQRERLDCVAASNRPQESEGSYMPCFLVGYGAARELAAVNGVPLYTFTHQQGHVAAVLLGANRPELVKQPFLAFHVSGGTTDALLVQPAAETIISCRVVSHSLDLKAGQLVDRVGGLLGLPFPAGPALEALALQTEKPYKTRPVLKGADCSLSGVENQCQDRMRRGEPAEEIARFCLDSILGTISAMTEKLLAEHGMMPVVYAGGVMSNSLIREELQKRFDGVFAPPAYSADNAAGIAWLGSHFV